MDKQTSEKIVEMFVKEIDRDWTLLGAAWDTMSDDGKKRFIEKMKTKMESEL